MRIAGRIWATPAMSCSFVVADQGVFGRQLFAADGFFLREEIIVDGEAVLLELGEELFEVLDFVQFLILLQALPVAASAGAADRCRQRARFSGVSGFDGFDE